MTISTTTASVTYTGNGATTSFAFSFLIPTGGITVYKYTKSTLARTTLTLDVDYSVSGLDDPAGGTVTYPLSGSPLASTELIEIRRTVALTQATALSNQGPFSPDSIEDALDKLTELVQQVNDFLGQSGSDPAVRLPIYTVATLPSASARAPALIYVRDEIGGAVPAFSDGTNWRRVTDRTIVS